MNKKLSLLLVIAVPLLVMGVGCTKSDSQKSAFNSSLPRGILMETNLERAVLESKNKAQFFKDPQNEDKFYYITNASVITPAGQPNNDGSGIYLYDLTKDKTYQKDGTFNINEGSSELFYQMLSRDRVLRGVGIIENKFVFVEQNIDYSPFGCGSMWLYPDLNYIDLSVAKSTKKPFTLSEDFKIAEQKKVDKCENSSSVLTNEYSNEDFTIKMPGQYVVTGKYPPKTVTIEGKKGKLGIFQNKSPDGKRIKEVDRDDEFDFGGDTTPPQKVKVVENKQTWFDVWMYYEAGDKKTEDELMAIFNSIKLR